MGRHIPKGYRIVREGKIRHGDLLLIWGKWVPAKGSVGKTVGEHPWDEIGDVVRRPLKAKVGRKTATNTPSTPPVKRSKGRTGSGRRFNMSISRKAMVEYLKNHFRYDTMNSWNAATSYAVKVKIHDFVPRELLNKAYDLIQVPETYYPINDIIDNWDKEQNYRYQAGFNGRSNGYIVMYEGGSKPSDYKSQCYNCGQKNYRADTKVCGRCGSDNMHEYTGRQVYTHPGRSIDQGETFEEWSTEEIRNRYRLVRSFDRMVEQCKKQFIRLCRDFQVREKTVMVEKKVKVLEAV